MKQRFLITLVFLIIAGCGSAKPAQPPSSGNVVATEIPCPGVEPAGLATGLQAYFMLKGNAWSAPLFIDASTESESIGELLHHERVTLEDGPICDEASAWWQVTTTEGVVGWLRVGPNITIDGNGISAKLIPFVDDAVQTDVPKERELEARVRYILADIQLGGPDVAQYYQDETAARPDDPEMQAARAALEILEEWGKDEVLANVKAFDRIPLRGGTSVVDAGTEFVQPGLDIVLLPCDTEESIVKACSKMGADK